MPELTKKHKRIICLKLYNKEFNNRKKLRVILVLIE